MSTTTISPLVHSQDEHNIAAMLTGESVQKIINIQDQLAALLGDAIWLTPPRCLHITLMEIIGDTQYDGMSREQHFTNWHEHYGRITKEMIGSFSPFSLAFTELHVSPGAIILKAANPKPLNDIRSSLLAKIVLPNGTKIPPQIAHCAIARFNKTVDLDSVISQASKIAVNFDEHITEFKLMKDLVPPEFNPVVAETYNLTPAAT